MTLRLNKTVENSRKFFLYWLLPTYEITFKSVEAGKGIGFRLKALVLAHKENEILKEKLKQVPLLEGLLQETLKENLRLKELLNLKSTLFFKTIPAQVISRDPEHWNQILYINCGLKEGVEPMVPVLGFRSDSNNEKHLIAGVIGRILESTAHTSKVLLISDPLSSIAVTLPRTQDQGLLQGEGSVNISLDYLDPSAQIQIGEEVHTSGLGGVFPPGLLVGRVTKILDSQEFKKVQVRSAIPLGRIKEVLVLLPNKKQ
ncbi:MAG: rod shape-determining protein MreC [Elusimicrobia bacterium RIFCSPLOWO2_12_FULL_39_28]|nr:MAG: rod shape-determining protein MreC [Elusimicrobia bacterium RIFCSPLOWO2_12_FULL_39_28]